MKVSEAIREAATRLAAASDTARLDAEVLMAHALGVSRSELLLRHMTDPAPEVFAALIERRLEQEPVAYIVGTQEFYGLSFEVTPDVLIPRSDSEVLIDTARALFANRPPSRILDLGTGSGALLLTALTIWPEAEGEGVDRDLNALMVAMRNADRVGVNGAPTDAELAETREMLDKAGIDIPIANIGWTGRARFLAVDWRKRGWRNHLGRFDLILANPPYVEDDAELAPSVRNHEPAGALFAGPEGLDDYRVLVPQLSGLLAPGGVALVEIGHRQAEAVSAIAAERGLAVVLHRDLGGRPRVLELKNSLGKNRASD